MPIFNDGKEIFKTENAAFKSLSQNSLIVKFD